MAAARRRADSKTSVLFEEFRGRECLAGFPQFGVGGKMVWAE